MRILVIFTGGTIGCAPPDENGIKRVADIGESGYFLLQHYAQTHGDYIAENGIIFDTREPLSTLSESITIAKWNVLIRALKAEASSIENGKYAGVVITHGTDTLSYTAALLSVLLSWVDVPVMLVSSGRHLHDLAANGHKNFADCVNLICAYSRELHGVFVPFSYDPARTVLYDASQIKGSQPFTHRYESRTGTDFGYIENSKLTKLANISKPQCNTNLLRQIGELEANVLQITPYIGLDYSWFDVSRGIKAVLHGTYHSSTFCMDDVQNFQRTCQKNGVSLYLAPYEQNTYADDREFTKIPNCTLELAYAKLLVGLSLFGLGRELDEFLQIEL